MSYACSEEEIAESHPTFSQSTSSDEQGVVQLNLTAKKRQLDLLPEDAAS